MGFLIKNFFYFSFVLLLFGCLNPDINESKNDFIKNIPAESTLSIENDLEAQQKILLAFAKGYPDKINDVRFIDNDWTMLVNGVRFYYANGRFLPEELRGKWENYLPYDFYEYPWKGTKEQRKIFFDNPVYSTGSSFLFDALYSAHTERESYKEQVKYSFLGVKIEIHSYIKNKLDDIVKDIHAAAASDNSIYMWIAELKLTAPNLAWMWRPIAGTNRRSNHSYGTAIDFIPRDLKDRLTYWRWRDDEEEEIEINKKNYYMPPEKVIKIFQEYGFLWGGNWALIDTMHFEYRPEILILNGYDVK